MRIGSNSRNSSSLLTRGVTQSAFSVLLVIITILQTTAFTAPSARPCPGSARIDYNMHAGQRTADMIGTRPLRFKEKDRIVDEGKDHGNSSSSRYPGGLEIERRQDGSPSPKRRGPSHAGKAEYRTVPWEPQETLADENGGQGEDEWQEGHHAPKREFEAATGAKHYYDNDTVQKQLRLFWNMATPYFKEEGKAKMLLVAVLLLTLTSSGVSVWFSYIGRDFWTALSTKNETEFYEMMRKFFGALVVGVPVNVMYKFQRQKLSLSWREWLTNRITELYYANRVYYVLEASKEIDNPDQRIAEDVRAFTKESLEFLITAMTSIIDLVAFSTILFKIYPQLFLAIIAYATVGTVITTSLGRQLVGLNFLQLQREAFFRYSLMRVRENSESIAFYGGEALELKEIRRRLQAVLDNWRDVIGTQRNLEFFTVSYRYLIQVIPGLVVAPLYFASKVELGVVSQSYSAFNHILADLSLIVNQFEALSAFSAGIDRLAEFLEKIQIGNRERLGPKPDGEDSEKLLSTVLSKDFLQELQAAQQVEGGVSPSKPAISPSSPSSSPIGLQRTTSAEGERTPLVKGRNSSGEASSPSAHRPISSGVEVKIVPGTALQLGHVSVVTPDARRTLVKDLSLQMQEGGRLLIVGNSGTGKSSLLRTMAGLWTTGSGTIVRPTTAEMFFLPQRPYCTLGSLRDQLTYPQKPGNTGTEGSSHSPLNDEELLNILETVDLGDLPVRVGNGSATLGLDVVLDWSGILSLGEQQRLAFGRLLYNRPRLAILDEATSALDLESEKKMYHVLQAVANISYVSVGHRPSLYDYHDSRLALTDEGYRLDIISGQTDGAY